MIGNTVKGRDGSIRIVELGAVIGMFQSWTLQREKKGEEQVLQTFRFTGELSYINPVLFNDTEYEAVIFVSIERDRRTGKAKQYRLESQRSELNGRSLLLEGVKVCQP